MKPRKMKNKYSNPGAKPNPKLRPKSDQNASSKENDTKASSPFFRHMLLFVISGLSILAFRKLPRNSNWEQGRIKSFYEEEKQYGDNMDSTYRYNLVHGAVANIVNFVQTNMKKKDDLFLLPTQYYLVENAYNENNPNEIFSWTNPSTFRNHSYGKFDFVDSSAPDSLLQKADFTLWVNNGQMSLLELADGTVRDSVINTFKKTKQHGIWSVAEAKSHRQTSNKP